MKLHKLSEFPTGWYLGAFSPTLHHTEDFEIAYKTYKANTVEPAHFHKIATEFTLILCGWARFYFPQRDETILVCRGEIMVIEPGEIVEFTADTAVDSVVIKIPGNGWKDKYLA
jgi:mannose-6-phosphate isomerase-like protein (cupin superfamily)